MSSIGIEEAELIKELFEETDEEGDIEKKVKKDKEKTDAELLEDEEEEVIEVGETIIVRI